MYYIDSKTLTERVIQYNKSVDKRNNNGISAMHNLIIDDIRVIIYSLPQETRLLEEEDACEFLLFMEPKLEKIIRNYRNNGTDFKSYLFPILIRKLKSFFKMKSIEAQHERTITHCHIQYQYELDEEENGLSYIAERRDFNIFETNELHKLKFMCRSSKTVRKRLFIYILHLASNFQNYDLTNICETFKFDYDETVQIIEKINILNPERSRTTSIKEKRNINWLRQLFLQEDLSVRNYFDDYSMNGIYQQRIDHYIDSFNNQTKQLSEKKKTISRTFIAKMLGISVANAGAAVYYTKNVLKYCTGEPQTAHSMGISSHIFKIIDDDSWHFMPVTEEKIFIPSYQFRLSPELQIEFKEQINYPHFRYT